MTLTSKPLAAILFLLLFGGIALSSALGWWQTESSKEPAQFTEGEFTGQSNPADIRGSYTFGDISNSFEITPDVLARAFQVRDENPDAFAVKDLESLYLDSSYEIGTNSVRLFVAFYVGRPFDTTGQEIYLPQPAVEILLDQANLTAQQETYIQIYKVDVTPASNADVEPAPAQSEEPAPEPEATAAADTVIKGRTTFGELRAWGVSQEVIEQIIGAPMPDPAMKVKDYATANGLDFETLKTQLQAEVDKAQK